MKAAIDKLEVMRDEFMGVEGKASSDEDMFASLKTRNEEIQDLSEEEAVSANRPPAVLRIAPGLSIILLQLPSRPVLFARATALVFCLN